MKNILKLLTVVCFPFFLFSCNPTPVSDGWRGENRDAKVTDFEVPAEWPSQLNTVWETEVGLANSSPVLVNGRIYLHVREDDVEKALSVDAENGNLIWQTDINPAPEVTGGAAPHPGPRSTPCIYGDKMFTLGTGGVFACLDAETGELLWKIESYTEVPEFYAAMSPIVVDGKCIAHLGGNDETGTIIAVNPENGDVVWSIEGEPATYSSPVTMNIAGEEILVLQATTDLLGISFDGELLWRIPTPTENRFYNSSTPIVDGQNVIVAGQGVGTISYRIEKTGDEYSFEKNWENPEFGVSFNTPVLNSGYLFGHESRLGKMFCLNAETGETAWADSTSRNRFAATLDLGEVLMTLPATADLLFFEPNPEEFTPLAEYNVSNTDVYAHPVVSGDRIYVKDEEMLTCFSLN